MHFGREYRLSQRPQWDQLYVEYDRLKTSAKVAHHHGEDHAYGSGEIQCKTEK